MAFHFVPALERVTLLGSMGVRLFFVLSGFLITQILMASREQPMGASLRSFYIRRSLRIFPVFYAVLAVAWLLNIGPVRQTFTWHISYLTNAYLFRRHDWHGSISHLWSLAVEQQFYVLWPFVILTVPDRWRTTVIAGAMAAAPLSRLWIGGPMTSVLPTSCLDSLGAGALLAIPTAAARARRLGAIIGIPVLAAAWWLGPVGHDVVLREILVDVGVSLTAMSVVGTAASTHRWTVLGSRPMRWLGTISYGAYLIHGFAPYLAGRSIAGFTGLAWPLRTAILVVVTLVAAQLSWVCLESPLLAVKDRLSPRRAVPPARAA